MAHIFISYSRVDRDFTERFVTRLRRMYRNYPVWYDAELPGGVKWWETILDQIAACDIFIYLLSNESVTSPYCQAEFAEALRLQKSIITVQVRDRTKLTGDLCDIQYVDMKMGINDAEAQAQLVDAINYQVEKLPQRRPRPLYPKRTLRPSVPDEQPRSPEATDVDTPTLAASSTMRRTDRRVSPTPTFMALMIALFLIILIVLLVIVSRPRTSTPAELTTTYIVGQNATTQAFWVATQTQAAITAQNATNTQVPNGTLANNSPLDPIQLVTTPVARNVDWTPYEGDFDGVPMMLVPAGCFDMGSEDGEANERPVSQVCLNTPFWVDKTEVTNAQFAHFGGAAARNSNWTGDNRPRERITWLEARDFCDKRGERLPTEAEWEYAARGPDGLIYPWGSDFEADKVVYGANSGSQTAAVGSRPAGASWVGALDMGGNVWEWVSSSDARYPYDASHESITNGFRILRGGAYGGDYPNRLRAAYRWVVNPNLENGDIGFRCARDL